MAEQKASDGLDKAVDKGVDGAMAAKNAVDAAQGVGKAAAAVGQSAATSAAGAGAGTAAASGTAAAAGTAVGGPAGTAVGAAVGLAASVLAKPVAKGIIVCVFFLAMVFKSLPSMLFEEPVDIADNTGPETVYAEFKEYALDAYDKEIESRKDDIEFAFDLRILAGEFLLYDDVVLIIEFEPQTEAEFRAMLEEDSLALIIAMFELRVDEWRKATFNDFKRAVNSVNFWHNTVTVSFLREEAETVWEGTDRVRYVTQTWQLHDKGIEQFRSKFGLTDDGDYIKAVEMAYNIQVYFGEKEHMPMGGVSVGGGGGSTGSYPGGGTHNLIRQLVAQLDEDQLMEYKGGLIIPIQSYSRVSSEFGLRNYARDPVHTGIDLAAAEGTAVYAATDGIILLREDYGSYAWGRFIVVYHGHDENGRAITTMYAHLSRFGSYGVGDPVSKGDTIGYSGETGWSEGPHLHFEYQIDGTAHNPRQFLPSL